MSNDVAVLQAIIVALVWLGTLAGAYNLGRWYQRRRSEGLTREEAFAAGKLTISQAIEKRKAELIQELEELGVKLPK